MTYDPRAGFQAKVIAHSALTAHNSEIITMQLRYPRFIHSEFMTHRMFSRNASSSRAIPVAKMIEQVWSDPAMPVHWGANQAGMQAREEIAGWRLKLARGVWKGAGKVACIFAWCAMKVGLHKQVANRILEPWQFISVVVTATEWHNFFELRDHEDAQPEIRYLAQLMREAMGSSTPIILDTFWKHAGAWHLPYISNEERKQFTLKELLAMSAARCARVSYRTHDGKTPDPAADIALHDRLVASKPIHASPTEHQACAVNCRTFIKNFRGWAQYRCWIEDNNTELLT